MRFLLLVMFCGLAACTSDTPSFLIVKVSGSEEDFLQFTASSDSIQVDFPLITERQRQRERLIHDACIALQLEPRINEGPDGARFLDCSIPSNVASVSLATRKLLRAVFRTNSETQLVFEHAP